MKIKWRGSFMSNQMQRLKIKKNNSFLNGEKYESLIQETSQLKRGERKKEPRNYQFVSATMLFKLETQ